MPARWPRGACARRRRSGPEWAILKEHHGHRFFAWTLTREGHFRFWVDRAKLRAELQVEGTYILQTNDTALDIL